VKDKNKSNKHKPLKRMCVYENYGNRSRYKRKKEM